MKLVLMMLYVFCLLLLVGGWCGLLAVGLLVGLLLFGFQRFEEGQEAK
jgi:hypothetical protein